MEKLYIFVETVLFYLADDLPSGMRNTGHMLNIVDKVNRLNLLSEFIQVGFDIVNMFPTIDNNIGLKTVFEIVGSHVNKFPQTQSVVEALVFNLQLFFI